MRTLQVSPTGPLGLALMRPEVAYRIAAGTLPLPDRVPVPLQQINLKVPERVAAHWRAQAAAAGLSVRDWLVSITAPTAAAPAAPAAGADGPELAERVALLEAATAELREAVTLLEAGPPRSPRPAFVPEAPADRLDLPPSIAGPALPERRLTPAEAAGLLTTPQVGEALGLASDSALTNWITREASKRGGSAVGGIYRGHRLRGKGLLPGGQKPGWLWERLEA